MADILDAAQTDQTSPTQPADQNVPVVPPVNDQPPPEPTPEPPPVTPISDMPMPPPPPSAENPSDNLVIPPPEEVKPPEPPMPEQPPKAEKPKKKMGPIGVATLLLFLLITIPLTVVAALNTLNLFGYACNKENGYCVNHIIPNQIAKNQPPATNTNTTPGAGTPKPSVTTAPATSNTLEYKITSGPCSGTSGEGAIACQKNPPISVTTTTDPATGNVTRTTIAYPVKGDGTADTSQPTYTLKTTTNSTGKVVAQTLNNTNLLAQTNAYSTPGSMFDKPCTNLGGFLDSINQYCGSGLTCVGGKCAPAPTIVITGNPMLGQPCTLNAGGANPKTPATDCGTGAHCSGSGLGAVCVADTASTTSTSSYTSYENCIMANNGPLECAAYPKTGVWLTYEYCIQSGNGPAECAALPKSGVWPNLTPTPTVSGTTYDPPCGNGKISGGSNRDAAEEACIGVCDKTTQSSSHPNCTGGSIGKSGGGTVANWCYSCSGSSGVPSTPGTNPPNNPPNNPPTNPPPQCISIVAYKNGNALSSSDLAALNVGDTITLAFAPGGNATKVRFQVNSGGWNETTTKNANSQFVWDYTLANTTSFNIQAQWFDGTNWN